MKNGGKSGLSGRTTIIGALPALQEVKKARPTSVLLQMFADAKLDEIIANLFESDHTRAARGL